jgi:hypothetical protein
MGSVGQTCVLYIGFRYGIADERFLPTGLSKFTHSSRSVRAQGFLLVDALPATDSTSFVTRVKRDAYKTPKSINQFDAKGGIYFTPPNAIGCGLTRLANGAGSTCTAC